MTATRRFSEHQAQLIAATRVKIATHEAHIARLADDLTDLNRTLAELEATAFLPQHHAVVARMHAIRDDSAQKLAAMRAQLDEAKRVFEAGPDGEGLGGKAAMS